MASTVLLLTIPASNRTAGIHRFQRVIPAGFTEDWIRMTVVMSDADFTDPSNAFKLRILYNDAGVWKPLQGDIAWRGNPNPPEPDRPDCSFRIVEPGKYDLRGMTVGCEVDIANSMNLGAVVEGVTY